MDAIIDNNMLKQDYYTPGSSIPIVNINQGLNLNPDIIFILAWNFKDEIIQGYEDGNTQSLFMRQMPTHDI